MNSYPSDTLPSSSLANSMPKKVPDDFHELMKDIEVIDQLKSQINKQYDLLDNHLEDVQDILGNTQMSKKEIRNRIQDYFFTQPERNHLDQRKNHHKRLEKEIEMVQKVLKEEVSVPKKTYKNQFVPGGNN